MSSLIALPIDDPEVETLYLFDDRFILATKASAHNKRLRNATADMLSEERLLLLEEGHCLRDQALSYCHMLTPEARNSFGASSLATIVQMVANGYGITRSCPKWQSQAKCIAGTSACCGFARPSLNARSGLPGARPLRAKPISSSSPSCYAMWHRDRENKRSRGVLKNGFKVREAR